MKEGRSAQTFPDKVEFKAFGRDLIFKRGEIVFADFDNAMNYPT